jgi:hypothetical protein
VRSAIVPNAVNSDRTPTESAIEFWKRSDREQLDYKKTNKGNASMDWAIDEAQQKLSEIVSAALKEPQWIRDREQRVAVVIDVKIFQEFLAWQQNQPQTLADAFAELRQVCVEEHYTLETPTRIDRSNAFADTLHDSTV